MTTLNRKQHRPATGWHVWLVRLLFAACLAFATEILLWTNIPRPFWLWLPALVGYIAIAALLLDLLVRFRVYELFGALVLMGLYAILVDLLLNVRPAFQAVPTTLVTRVMGAQAVAGFAALGVFFVFFHGVRRPAAFLTGGAVTGFLWGVWVRGYQIFFDLPPINTWGFFGVGTVGVLLLIGLAIVVGNFPRAHAAQLTRLEWGIMLAVLIGLFIIGLARGTITRPAITPATLISVYVVLMLWFQKRQKPGHLLDGPMQRPSPLFAAALVVFLAVGGLTYAYFPPPPEEQLSVFSVMTVFFAAVGLVWLPAVSLVLGVRAYRQMTRTGKLL